MSKYTTEVRFICENAAGLTESKGYSKIDEILTESAPIIFNFEYPIFDEAYRIPLEKKILRHFYTREICEETVGLWKLRLEDKMNVIMPYFNQLYESELIKFNPMWDTDIRTTHSGTEDGEASNTHDYTQKTVSNKSGNETFDETGKNKENEIGIGSVNSEVSAKQNDTNKQKENGSSISNGEVNSTTNETGSETGNENNKNYDLYSDTPQGGLTGVDNENYLTNARKVTQENDNSRVNERKGSADEVSNNVTQNVNSLENESNREANTETNTVNQDNRNRNQENERNSNRVNIESGTVDYTNIGSGGNRFNNTNQYIENIMGKRGYGSYSKMLIEFRDTFLNIDEMILDALEPLFMGLW